MLHFIPGFVSSDELLAELSWVERLQVLQAAAEDQCLALRSATCQVAAADRAIFAVQFESRWADAATRHGPSTVDLPPAVQAAYATLARVLAGRTAVRAGRPGALRRAAHAAWGLLPTWCSSEFPLVALDDLRGRCLRCLPGGALDASPRREMLETGGPIAATAGRACCSSLRTMPLPPARVEPFAWPPPNVAAMPLLDRLATQVVSLDELAELIADADLDSVTYKPADGPPRFLLYRGGAKPTVRICARGTTHACAGALPRSRQGL